MRKIKVFSTATGLKIVESSAITWGELKEQLSNEDISVSNVKAVENKTNTTLELDDAKLPESDFVLMLSPEKTKSGGYKEVRETIQTIISLNGETAKNHFNQGKNYTIKSYSELESLLSLWYLLSEEDEDNYDDDYEEGKVYFHNCIDKIIYEIRNCSEYNSRPDSMEKAIELIVGTKTINDLCIDNQKIMSNLTSEELNWLNRFK